MFRFTGYEYIFKYKPGKLNKNADALFINHPEMTDEEINENLPRINVMIIEEKKNTEENKAKSIGPTGERMSFRTITKRLRKIFRLQN